MSDTNDWEEGTFSDEEYEPEKKVRNLRTTIKCQILNQIITSLIVLKDIDIHPYLDENIQKEPLPLNRMMFINAMVQNSEEKTKNALLFRLFLFYKIPTRLMMQITNSFYKFVEVHTCYEKTALGKYKGGVLLLDCEGLLSDATFLYGVQIKYYRLFTSVINILNNYGVYDKLGMEKLPSGYFKNEWQDLCNIVPKSLAKIRIHPKYVVESILRPEQIVHPRRPIAGYINGEPVLPKENVVTLETERQLYRKGKKLNCQNPYRIIQKGDQRIKIYAEWQTEKIDKVGFEGGNMDYFHENHIPTDCLYFEDDDGAKVCKLVDIDYRICCVGFCKRMPMFKGIFVKKTDYEILSVAVVEFKRCRKINEEIEDMKKCLLIWKKLIKKARLYKNIKERIGN